MYTSVYVCRVITTQTLIGEEYHLVVAFSLELLTAMHIMQHKLK